MEDYSSSTGTWGALTVFREKDRPYFSSSEVRLVASLTGLISDGLRRSLLLDDACADRDDTGMLVLDPGDGVGLANRAAEQWVDELGIGTRAGTTLPLVIRAVARQARAITDLGERYAGEASTGLARARVRTKAGRWVTVRASVDLLQDRHRLPWRPRRPPVPRPARRVTAAAPL